MKDEHRIIQQVYAAKGDMREADELIRTYMPFIRTETAKWLKRPPQEGRDDELSIAMIAFHEAVQGYSRVRGSFLKYAALTIKSRLIDYHRREQRHRNAVSLDTPADEDESPLSQTIQDGRNHEEELAVREATRGEIEELSARWKHLACVWKMWQKIVPNSRERWRPAGTSSDMPGRRKGFWKNFSEPNGFP